MNARHITCENQGIVFGYAMAMSNVARLVVMQMPECGYAQSFAYAYDALSRPISRNADTFAYNVRGEVVSATVGGNGEAHSYDHIGNAVLAASGGVTNAYTANSLNQYTAISANANPVYDPLPADPRRRPGAGRPAGHAGLRRRREHDGRRKLPLCVRCGEQAGFRISRFSGRRFARRRVLLRFQHEVPRPRNGACRLPAPFLQSRPRPLAQPRSNWSNNCAMGGG